MKPGFAKQSPAFGVNQDEVWPLILKDFRDVRHMIEFDGFYFASRFFDLHLKVVMKTVLFTPVSW